MPESSTGYEVNSMPNDGSTDPYLDTYANTSQPQPAHKASKYSYVNTNYQSELGDAPINLKVENSKTCFMSFNKDQQPTPPITE